MQNPPGRPIVSSIGSLTEHLVDLFLKPLVTNLPSYIRDTMVFLNELQDVVWEERMSFVTLDIVGLYTCIENEKGKQALNYFLGNRSVSLQEH